jgi:ribosomal protein S18 acetylase RimI-like enzyme
VAAIGRLLPQFSSSARIPDADHVARIIESRATKLFAARDADQADKIVGILTLLTFAVPSGVRAQIHDVVVDESARGRGIAEKLVRHALEIARASGARNVDLTSRPAREAANRLYPRIGFKRHETNLYRYTFADG